MIFQNTKIWHSPSTSKQNIGNRTPLSEGRKKKYIAMFGSFTEPFNSIIIIIVIIIIIHTMKLTSLWFVSVGEHQPSENVGKWDDTFDTTLAVDHH